MTTVGASDHLRTEEVLLHLVECTKATGRAFFEGLVRGLAEGLGVRCALVAEVDPRCPSRARTLAVWIDGQPAENFEYDLAGTPCQDVVAQRTCSYSGGIRELFPEDRFLAQLGLDAYVGTPLRGSDGATRGLLAVMHDRPIDPALRPETLLEVFAGRAAAELERERAEDQLRELDRRKDEFLAVLAHELRNPLAPIRNAVEVLRLLAPRDEQLGRVQEVVSRQLRLLTRLVEDLLDVTRIARGKVRLRQEPVDVNAVIAQAVETSKPQIDARRHELAVSLPDEPVRVLGDATRLAQVVANLLNNAAKYTEVGGRIRLAVATAGPTVAITVADNGMGITADLLPRVFDLFTQADSAADRAQGGLGIGLTLVRRLVEMHGGKVEAKSAGPGCGSEFVVRLPALAETGSRPAPAPERPTPSGRTHRRVLIVDDNTDAAESLALLLRLWGQEMQLAHDGPSALKAAQASRPEVVVLDIGLPRMDGYEVARRLRAEPDLARVLLVAMTGYGHDEARRRTAEAGFDHHLVKPVDPAALYDLLTAGRAVSTGQV